jgi:hypothetical protein
MAIVKLFLGAAFGIHSFPYEHWLDGSITCKPDGMDQSRTGLNLVK